MDPGPDVVLLLMDAKLFYVGVITGQPQDTEAATACRKCHRFFCARPEIAQRRLMLAETKDLSQGEKVVVDLLPSFFVDSHCSL